MISQMTFLSTVEKDVAWMVRQRWQTISANWLPTGVQLK